MYRVRRAYYILTDRGVKSLTMLGLDYLASRLGVSAMFFRITGKPMRGGKVNSFGVVMARTLPDNVNPTIHIPFGKSHREIRFDKAAVVAHIFYTELSEEIVKYIKNIPIPFGVFITTDTEDKKKKIEGVFGKSELDLKEFEVRVTPNRGRDIAPKYIEFRDVYERYEAFLHIHTKKSIHTNGLGNIWRRYLLEHLIGSRDIARTNLEILSTDNIGIVYPEHLKRIKKHINWGYNFQIARELLAKTGVTLDTNTILEFPSGSMFWGRSQAIRKILDLNLAFTDFPEENSQIDGTLAHAIERSLLLFVEKSGHSWARVTTRAPKKAQSEIRRKFIPLLNSEWDIVR